MQTPATDNATPNLADRSRRNLAAQPALIALVLALVTLALYWRVVGCDFVKYDDDDYFASNQQVQSGLSLGNLLWAFQTTHAGNWHPLTWISLMLDAEVFGAGPAGPHRTNLLLHAANAVLLFLLLRWWTGAHWRSAAVAGLFAWHPLHVESVAWISERKDVLSMALGLLALWAYGEYARGQAATSASPMTGAGVALRNNRWYWLAFLFLALGLMAKPMLVTLPCVMLLLDGWPLKRWTGDARSARRLGREKLPFFALALASCVVTFWVQKQGGAVHSLESIGWAPRLENAVVSYARYLVKAVWPANLAIFYPHPGHWPPAKVLVGVAVVVGGSWVAWRLARRQPWLPVGWFWYLGTLVPVIGLVQVGTQSMADRYSYFPLVGVFLGAVWAGNYFLNHRPAVRPIGVMVAIGILAACLVQTHRQVMVWQNSETLFRHAASVTRGNAMAHYNLGAHYLGQQRWDQAVAEYRAALQIQPTHTDALINLGVALVTRGEREEGIVVLREAVKRRPELFDAHYNLGNALVQKREYAEAERCFETALSLRPDSASAHNNLGNLLAMRGQKAAAAGHFREVLRLDPNHAGARRQLEILTGGDNPSAR